MLDQGQRFGDYEFLEEIGRGGMGMVYRARQKSLDRLVAVKMLLPGLSSPEYLRRFRAEASTAAGLQHPNIVAIHEVGVWEGRQYLVMDYVAGRSLAQVTSDFGFRISDFRRTARWLKAIAEAVHYAHEHGILHRDLKPSNVLIDQQEQPRLTDFGLAKRFEEQSQLTLSGQVLGSPSYMPPEQAEVSRGKVSRRSDVYGLGATLYHLLTGRAPFQGETPTEVLHQVLSHEPMRPRLLNPGVPPELETICLKCLEKEPTRRYANAQRVTEELERFLEGKPIVARPISASERLWRWCKRKPVVAGLATGLTLAMGFGLLGVISQSHRAQLERRRAENSLVRSEHERYAANVALIRTLIDQKRFQDARERLADESLIRYRGWEWGWLLRRCHLDLATFSHPRGTFVEFAPDGTMLATTGNNQEVRLWDLASGRLQRVLQSSDQVRVPHFSPDGKRLIAVTWGQPATVWEVASGTILFRLTNSSPRYAARFSPDGRVIATGDSDGHVRLFDAQTGAFSGRSKPYDSPQIYLAFSPDGRSLAYGGGDFERDAANLDTTVRLWDLTTDQVTVLGRHDANVTCLAFSPDGKWLASSSFTGLKTWDVEQMCEVNRLELPEGILRGFAVTFSPDGRQLAAAGLRDTRPWAQVFEIGSGRPVRGLDGHSYIVVSMAYSPDGSRLATGSGDGTAKVWPGEGVPDVLTLEGHDAPVWAVACSGDGQRIATGGLDQAVRLWDSTSGALLRTIHTSFPVVSLALNREGNQVITPSSGATATVWDVTNGTPLLRLTGHSQTVMAVALSPDGRHLATAGKDHTARLWDATTGAAVGQFSGHTNWVLAVAFSPEGRRLLTGSADRIARVWDLATGRTVFALPDHEGAVLSVAFSPDGQQAATGADRGDCAVRLWDLRSGKLRWKQSGHRDGISSLSFSPDGRRLATAPGGTEIHSPSEWDPAVIIWDVETGHDVFRFEWIHTNMVRVVAFSPDGSRLVTGGGDHLACVLNAFPYDHTREPGQTLSDRIESYKRRHSQEQTGLSMVERPPEGLRTNLLAMTGWINLPVAAAGKMTPPPDLPPRDPVAGPSQLDLSSVYNATLGETWQPVTRLADVDLALSAMTAGVQEIDGVRFDVRGIVQLRRAAPSIQWGWFAYPERVRIPAGRRFGRLHVLHATTHAERSGTVVGAYHLRYADGGQHPFEIVCGRDLDDWTVPGPGPGVAPSEAVVAWTAPRPPDEARLLRLFHRIYVNPHPDREVVAIDFSSAMRKSGPFLVAITVD
jgi:WD40 repeat protein/serine/threonine protein kinase